MDGFIRVDNTLINAQRLIAIGHKEAETTQQHSRPEHYLAVFDTGQELMLTPEQGRSLLSSPMAQKAISGNHGDNL